MSSWLDLHFLSASHVKLTEGHIEHNKKKNGETLIQTDNFQQLTVTIKLNSQTWYLITHYKTVNSLQMESFRLSLRF